MAQSLKENQGAYLFPVAAADAYSQHSVNVSV